MRTGEFFFISEGRFPQFDTLKKHNKKDKVTKCTTEHFFANKNDKAKKVMEECMDL